MLIALPVEVAAHVRRENLHVAREHQQLRAGLLEHLHDAALLPRLVAVDDREVVIRQPVPFGEAAHVLVVRDHRDHLERQRAGAGSGAGCC